jgi:hypothetical protein
MMRKFTLTLLVILAFGSLSFGQATASLPTITSASPNENVAMDLNVTNFLQVGSISLKIQIDTTVLSYINTTNPQTTNGTFYVQRPTGASFVSVEWVVGTGDYVNFTNGRLFTLNFKYNGLSCPLVFTNVEVAKGRPNLGQIIPVTTTDGSISPYLSNTEQAHLGNVTTNIGGIASVPLTYIGLAATKAGAITQRISYDPGKLTFINVTGSGNLSSGINAGAAAGIVTIVWTNNLTGALINATGTRFNVNFQVNGSTSTPVSFSTGCVITAFSPQTNIAVTYNNGSVSPTTTPTSFAKLTPAITNAVQGQFVYVPLTLSGMPSNTSNFDVYLIYDNPRMDFIGVQSAVQPVTESHIGSSIHITNTNPLTASPSINTQFLVLKFRYNSVGTANIMFDAGSQFSNGSPIAVGYENGSVSPATAVVNANIGVVSATSPASVQVPVTFTNIPGGTTAGAVTMNIEFDALRLTYVNYTSPLSLTVQPNGNVLNITWFYTSTPIVNGTPFITLNFNYAASGSSAAKITFKDGCQLSEYAPPTSPIIPTNWNSGGVNTTFKLSGTLKYDNHPPYSNNLAGFTITLKTYPAGNFVGTATTNASGYYEFTVTNGTYKLFTAAPVTATWYASDYSASLIFLYANGYNLITDPTALKYQAGDVNLDGWMLDDDANDVFYRANGYLVPDYIAPDWLFQLPVVTISGANLPNQNYFGICSGDVAGEGPIF